MAKYITSKIAIDGQDFLPSAGYQVRITQKIIEHHSFEIIFPTESTESNGGLFDVSVEFVGKKISIIVGEGELEFLGLITNVDLEKADGSNGSIRLSGYSPTILMQQTIQSKSYDEGTDFDHLISETTQGYPADLISIISGNETSLKLPYTVQYAESDFDFLKRMCIRYGLWFYYNGNELCLGAIGDGNNEGVYGKDISKFHLGVQIQPQQFAMKSFDWHANEVLESESDAYIANTPHTYADHLKNESDAVYRKKGSTNYLHTQNEYAGQKGVDDVTKIEVLSKAANMIVASGVSELSDLRIGNILTVEGLNYESSDTRDALGSYILTEITHTFNHAGHYSNSWQGLPEGVAHPPYSDIYKVPKAETQRAVVKENIDPENLGRIKVQFPWQKDFGTTTPWIKVNTPYAGLKKGFCFTPEIDEEVLISFEGDNIERPFVVGSAFNATAKSEIDNTDNNIKAIITRSGHTIKFDDTEGSEKISIHDHEGSVIIFDTAEKSLQISATENLEVSAKNISIIAEEDINIQAKGDIAMAAEGNYIVQSKGDSTYQSDGDMNNSSKGNISIEASGDATIKGKNVEAEGQTGATLKGTQTKIEGKMTAVQGASGKIDIA